MKKWMAGLAVVSTAGVALLVAPAHASAGTGVISKTVACNPMSYSSGGVVRAKLRNCTTTWYKDLTDGSSWVTVSAQLLDSSTDGYCAKTRYTNLETFYVGTECNGVWTTKPHSFDLLPIDTRVEIVLWRAKSSDDTYPGGGAYQKVDRPVGY
ncbi:hypothetical protein ABZ865_40135 [Streptomyces sp. NPDC047085]|uniref:hypothetical protein n=1 Tax=Streptomyces sp. NPDC047085 TaxID=3155140 RepID=UPI0033F21AA8